MDIKIVEMCDGSRDVKRVEMCDESGDMCRE